jgi:hypothetical protein
MCLTTGAINKFTSAVEHKDLMDFDRPSVERDAIEDSILDEFRGMFSYLARLYGEKWMATPLHTEGYAGDHTYYKLFKNLLNRDLLPRTFMYSVCREFMQAGAVYHSG